MSLSLNDITLSYEVLSSPSINGIMLNYEGLPSPKINFINFLYSKSGDIPIEEITSNIETVENGIIVVISGNSYSLCGFDESFIKSNK